MEVEHATLGETTPRVSGVFLLSFPVQLMSAFIVYMFWPFVLQLHPLKAIVQASGFFTLSEGFRKQLIFRIEFSTSFTLPFAALFYDL